MTTKKSKFYFKGNHLKVIVAPIIVFFFSLFFVSFVKSDETENAKAPDVSLMVAPILSSSDNVAFIMTNISQKPIEVDSAESYPCKIVIIRPDGEKEEISSNGGPPGVGLPPVLKPGETKQWDVNIGQYFVIRQLTKKGIYRIIWVYNQWISKDQAIEIKSNELLIMKNEDSPRIDPRTGEPE